MVIESRWKRNCPALSSAETEVILWPRSFKNCTADFVDWAQSFQSNRLEHVRPWQCGVLGLFSGRRRLSCGASRGCRGRNVGVCQRGSDCNIPCERQTSLPGYQRQTIRAFVVTTKETRRFLRDWNFFWGKCTWNDFIEGVMPCDLTVIIILYYNYYYKVY